MMFSLFCALYVRESVCEPEIPWVVDKPANMILLAPWELSLPVRPLTKILLTHELTPAASASVEYEPPELLMAESTEGS